MHNISRRSFLKSSALVAAASALPARSWAQVAGANDDIRIGVIGFNSQGRVHIEGFRKTKGARVVALCDVDSQVVEREAKKFRDRNEPIATFTDVRKLLASKEIDAISTATPNHWHSLIAIWGCQAGKDVYVEKPVSHNVAEGRKIVEAARQHNRIVQTGTQSRSSAGIREAILWLHAGNLGKIQRARGFCYKRRRTIGKVNSPQPVPASIDYNLWTGPAPLAPLMRYRLHYDWHWQWPTGSGDVGNQGIHEMDLARWALGEPRLSPQVVSIGGRFGYYDDGETPNTQIVMHNYERAPLFFEVRGLPEKSGTEKLPNYLGVTVGVVVDCEHGQLIIRANEAVALDTKGKEIKKFGDRSDHRVSHFANFIESIRLRNYGYLNADILEGHISSALCHTGNISHRLGAKAGATEIAGLIKEDKAAEEAFERFREHLAANGVKLDQAHATLGPVLKMDAGTERFTNHKDANALLTRQYRQGFAVPERL